MRAVVPTPGWAEDVGDVRRCLAGDREAFNGILIRHQGLVRAHSANIAGCSDADDIAQEAFIRAWQALERYDERYPMRTWLLIIATRLAMNRVTRRRHLVPWEDAVDLPGSAPDGNAEMARDRLALLNHSLAELSPADRALFELRYRQGLAAEDVAEALGITTNALKVRLHRLRRRLALRLGLHPSGEDDHGT